MNRAALPYLSGLIVILAQGCASTTGPRQPEPAPPELTLEDRVAAAILTPPMNQVHWGILAVDAETGDTLYALNEARKFTPASNMKVLVTAAALSELGPNYRYRTPIWADGQFDLDAGVLEGDLVVESSGDPTLSRRFYRTPSDPLDSIVSELRRTGLSRITGDLVIDVSQWDSVTVPSSWMVGNLSAAFGATGGAFTLYEGAVEIEVRATSFGDPPELRWFPLGEEGFVISEVTTSTATDSARTRIRSSYLPESRRLLLQGTIPEGTVDTLLLSIRDPIRQAAFALDRAVRESGIEIGGELQILWPELSPTVGARETSAESCPRVERGPNGRCMAGDPFRSILHLVESPPMFEIARATLEPSQNWIAEQILRTLGAPPRGDGRWRDALDSLGDFLVNEVGVDSLDFSFQDGSGLSAYNVVTPRAMVSVLEFMDRSPIGETYRNALASPGEEDSTLEERLLDLEGKLFAKTGTISNVNALSGYLETIGGHGIIFSILTNGSGLPSGQVRQAMDEVVRALRISR